jgi:hypothetical protein
VGNQRILVWDFLESQGNDLCITIWYLQLQPEVGMILSHTPTQRTSFFPESLAEKTAGSR